MVDELKFSQVDGWAEEIGEISKRLKKDVEELAARATGDKQKRLVSVFTEHQEELEEIKDSLEKLHALRMVSESSYDIEVEGLLVSTKILVMDYEKNLAKLEEVTKDKDLTARFGELLKAIEKALAHLKKLLQNT